jgi:trans-2,3-dihydro-3-hydroxyanthranilate isomerase
MRLAYHLLDVFTDVALAGNPLAVVSDAEAMSSEQMQAVAREFNLSETVFLLIPRNKLHSARLRIFTPTHELPFAGHPTVGAACLIAFLRAPEMLGRHPLHLVLEEEIGLIGCDVQRFRGAVRASLIAPQTPALGAPLEDFSGMAGALGLTKEDIGFDDHRPVIASAGVPFAFVPVTGLAALNRLAPKLAFFREIFPMERPAVCVYTRETADAQHHVQARVFVPGFGIIEDPATGAAACAFAAVATAFEKPEDGEHTIVIEQGYAMGRPSLITLTMQVFGGKLTEAGVGGASVIVGEGFLTI